VAAGPTASTFASLQIKSIIYPPLQIGFSRGGGEHETLLEIDLNTQLYSELPQQIIVHK